MSNSDQAGDIVVTETTTRVEVEAANGQPGPFSRAVYAFGYCVSFGVTFPTMLVVRALPLDNALGRGLFDGACAADESAMDVHARIQHSAGAVAGKANDAYAGVTQYVQERVEKVQDAMAERRYRRSLEAAAM
jgi:hypothetical protein